MLAAALAIAAAPTPALPSRASVEGALHWQEGSLCRLLIDDCVDGEGNEISPLPQFTVSALDCRPAAARRATCSFTAARHYGPGDVRPSERCTGTLQSNDLDGTWRFVVPNPRRQPHTAMLSCN